MDNTKQDKVVCSVHLTETSGALQVKITPETVRFTKETKGKNKQQHICCPGPNEAVCENYQNYLILPTINEKGRQSKDWHDLSIGKVLEEIKMVC